MTAKCRDGAPVTSVALGPKGSYVISWSSGQISWSSKLKRGTYKKKNKCGLYHLLNGRYKQGQDNSPVAHIGFARKGGYAVVYDNGCARCDCDDDLVDALSKAGGVRCLTVGPGGSYILIDDNGFRFWKGVPERANELLHTRNNAEVQWAALGQDGSYFLLFDDGAYYRHNLPPKLDELLQDWIPVERLFLSIFDASFVLQSEGCTHWIVNEEFDSELDTCPRLYPSDIGFSHNDISAVFGHGKCSIKDTFLSIHRGELEPEDVPKMKVVCHKGKYVSLNNRRLAMFRLVEMYSDENLKVPVELIDKPRGFKVTSRSNGDYAFIRGTDFYIDRTLDETNFDPHHDRLRKAR